MLRCVVHDKASGDAKHYLHQPEINNLAIHAIVLPDIFLVLSDIVKLVIYMHVLTF